MTDDSSRECGGEVNHSSSMSNPDPSRAALADEPDTMLDAALEQIMKGLFPLGSTRDRSITADRAWDDLRRDLKKQIKIWLSPLPSPAPVLSMSQREIAGLADKIEAFAHGLYSAAEAGLLLEAVNFLRAALPPTLNSGAVRETLELSSDLLKQVKKTYDCPDSPIINLVLEKIAEVILAIPRAVEGWTRAYQAARENLREAWSALAMIRETVETLAPSGSVKAAEHLDGPTFMHEAEALVAGILALYAEENQRLSDRIEELEASQKGDLCPGGVNPGWDECEKCGATSDDECRARPNTGDGK